MKKFVYLSLVILCATTSCVSRKTAEKVENQRDSLEVVVYNKDSLINAVFTDINSITENLSLIKTRENLLTIAGDGERARRPVDEINNDIAAIDRLLQENKTKIASLQRSASQLRKANLRIEGLEKMIVDLNTQLNDKNDEVTVLKNKLSNLGVEVKTLNEKVSVQSDEIEELASEKTELQNRMSTVYYIVGPQKELLNAQIINKQGFIGRTVTVNPGGNLDSFTRTDARLLEELPINEKKVKIITNHPEGSYKLVAGDDKVVKSLVITDPEEFWRSSKILVVSYK